MGFMEPTHKDTPQQQKALRVNAVAKRVRQNFPTGTRVEGVTTSGGTGVFGTVECHIPMLNAQGGTLVVRWDSGHTGRHSACDLRRVERP